MGETAGGSGAAINRLHREIQGLIDADLILSEGGQTYSSPSAYATAWSRDMARPSAQADSSSGSPRAARRSCFA
jgi:hypothetical protein